MAQVQVVAEIMNDLSKIRENPDSNLNDLRGLMGTDRAVRLARLGFIKRHKHNGSFFLTQSGVLFYKLVSESSIVATSSN